MKKLLACLCAATLLAGCGSGSSEPVKESKTCTVTEEGMPMEIKMNAVDNEIETMNMSVSIENDFSGVSDEDKASLKEAMINEFGLGEDAKGVTADIVFTDTAATIKIDLDLKNADKTVLEAFDLDGFFTNMKLDANVKDLESDGATCK